MNRHDYEAFTAALLARLDPDPRVVGLMAVGSMAGRSHTPDDWSDHDFWLVVTPEAQTWFQTRADWLPDGDRIVLWFREPHGGFKALYDHGHLIEYAVSDRAGLLHARVNDYRLLIDRINLADDLARMQAATTAEAEDLARDGLCLFGQFVTALLVGVGRCRRGERLSGRQVIDGMALAALLRLIPTVLPPQGEARTLDNLDPLRRFEAAYPALGAEINALLDLAPEQAAGGLLDLADGLLRDRMPGYPAQAVAAVRARIAG